MLALVVSMVEEAVKLAPQVATDLQTIFSNPAPTPADWETLRAKVQTASYASYVPDSALSAGNSTTGAAGSNNN